MANPSGSDARTRVVVKHFANAVPTRPTLSEAQAMWKAARIPDVYITRLSKEYDAATVYDKADSTTRADILKKGGSFYPTTVTCKRQSATPSLLQSGHVRQKQA